MFLKASLFSCIRQDLVLTGLDEAWEGAVRHKAVDFPLCLIKTWRTWLLETLTDDLSCVEIYIYLKRHIKEYITEHAIAVLTSNVCYILYHYHSQKITFKHTGCCGKWYKSLLSIFLRENNTCLYSKNTLKFKVQTKKCFSFRWAHLAALITQPFSSLCLYLSGGLVTDELLINPYCPPSSLAWTVRGLELLTRQPEVQVFLRELWLQKFPKCCLSTCKTRGHHFTIQYSK